MCLVTAVTLMGCFAAGHPTTVPVKDMPLSCLHTLHDAVFVEGDGWTNEAGKLQLCEIELGRCPSPAAHNQLAEEKLWSHDAVGILRHSAAAFATGTMIQKLLSLDRMNAVVGDKTCRSEALNYVSKLTNARDRHAAVLAEIKDLPVGVMGQPIHVEALSTLDAELLLQFCLQQALAKLAPAPMVFTNERDSKLVMHMAEVGCIIDYSTFSHAEKLQQQGGCKLYLGNPSGALADLDAALQADPDNVITYHYRSAAHTALANHTAALLDANSEKRLKPNPDFVIVSHQIPEDNVPCTLEDKMAHYKSAIAGAVQHCTYGYFCH